MSSLNNRQRRFSEEKERKKMREGKTSQCKIENSYHSTTYSCVVVVTTIQPRIEQRRQQLPWSYFFSNWLYSNRSHLYFPPSFFQVSPFKFVSIYNNSASVHPSITIFISRFTAAVLSYKCVWIIFDKQKSTGSHHHHWPPPLIIMKSKSLSEFDAFFLSSHRCLY